MIASDALFIVVVVNLWRVREYSGAYYLLHVVAMSMLPVKFCLAARRLHDLGQSMLWALPLLLLCTVGCYNNYFVPLTSAPFFDVGVPLSVIFPRFANSTTVLGLTVAGYIVLTDLVLCVIPGNQGANRYGLDPRRDDSPVDIF